MFQALTRGGRGLLFPTAFLAALFVFCLGPPSPASAQGITFNVAPSARWIEWDEDLGFRQSRMWGGAAGIGFGRFVGLQAFHHQGDRIKLLDIDGGAEAPQLFDIAQSGAQVSLGLGSGTIVPILVGGGSLLTFQPRGGEELKKLSLDYGGGFKVVFGERLHGELLLESTQYRLDPSLLATGEPGFEGTGPLRRNMTLRASLGLQLGRRSFDKASELDNAFADRYQAPFSNFALAVEPLIGRLDYDKAVGLEDQEMVGVRAGVDFGSFFGLRGFHWWGTSSDFQSIQDFRAWGGEAQFTLSGGPGLNPYLTGGAGQLEWGKAKEDEPPLPEDQTALILGGGVDFNFGPRIRATVAARDFILAGSDLSASSDLNTISDPDELVHNWQFSAGLKFLIGGSGIRSGRQAQSPGSESPGPGPGEAAPATPGEPGTQVAAATPVTPTADTPVRTTVGAEPAVPAGAQPGTAVDTIIQKAVPGQTIVLPILERGEIYIRFGEPGSTPLVTAVRPETQGAVTVAPAPVVQAPGLTLEDVRRIIQEELARQPDRPAPDPEQLQELESRLQRRLDDIERAARRAEVAAAGQTTVVVSERPEEEAVPERVRVSTARSRRLVELRPYSGFNVTGDVQVLLGLGADIGPITAGSRFNLVPQAALGFGQGPTSFLVSADVEYRLPEVEAGPRVTFEPMISAGPGLIKRDKMELQLGMFLGTGIRLYKRNGERGLHLFGGIQGVDFFDDTRIIIGVRMPR